jgi:hypothetical protein
VIDGYSRQILAGMATDYQDELAILQLLHAALSAYGHPDGIVSDNAGVFTAAAYRHLWHTLTIDPDYIEKGQAWQNLIEAQFKIQLRLADARFEQATTLAEIQAAHAAFIETFNTTPHWAHRERADGRRTPMAVLDQARGRDLSPERLRQLFRQLQFGRTVNQYGFVSVQRFYIYAEQGLAKQRVSVWIYEDRLYIEHRQIPLARYHCRLDRRQKALTTVSQPHLYDTAFASPNWNSLSWMTSSGKRCGPACRTPGARHHLSCSDNCLC